MNDNARKDAALAGALNAAALVGVMQGSYAAGLDEQPLPT